MVLQQNDSFLETKRHGSLLFPFNIYPCTIPKDFPSVGLHWQKSMELVFVKKGRGLVQVALNQMDAQGGDIFVLPPGTLHAIRGRNGQAMEYENIIFDVDFLGGSAVDVCARQVLAPLAAGQLPLPARLRPGQPAYDDAVQCLNEADRLCGQRPPAYELGVKAAMLRFLFVLLQLQPEEAPPEHPATQRLRMVLGWVEEHYAQPVRVEQMAQLCGCSPSHFMRWFKQMTGVSFVTYLNERRLAGAAEQLRLSDESILSIAGSVGFENLSNFNRQFKARYGVSPRQYRCGHRASPCAEEHAGSAPL